MATSVIVVTDQKTRSTSYSCVSNNCTMYMYVYLFFLEKSSPCMALLRTYTFLKKKFTIFFFFFLKFFPRISTKINVNLLCPLGKNDPVRLFIFWKVSTLYTYKGLYNYSRHRVVHFTTLNGFPPKIWIFNCNLGILMTIF